MKLFADECVYQKTVASIKEWGHDIITAREVELTGKSDNEILEYAVKERRVLITADLDFSNVRHYPPSDHWGIIVLKIKPSILSLMCIMS
jgi:predicted nuclease of predicted toxin-antitoxin system